MVYAVKITLEIFKIIRGYGGSAVCATQDLNDFFALDDGKYGKGIINNCKTKIILNLEDEEAQRVQSILRLSEVEIKPFCSLFKDAARLPAKCCSKRKRYSASVISITPLRNALRI